MVKSQVKINFNNLKNIFLRNKINKVFSVVAQQLNIEKISVNLTITDLITIQNLNNEFRKQDKPTDVLSFPQFDFYHCEKLDEQLNQERNELNKIIPIQSLDIGDVVICKVVAKMQAKKIGHSYSEEVCFLALHGFLHLLGYDHIEKDDEKIMFSFQKKILKKIKEKK